MKKNFRTRYYSIFIIFIVTFACNTNGEKIQYEKSNEIDSVKYKPEEYVKLNHPEWCKNAAIYELNIRQFTKEGTFKAAQKQLIRLKEIGVDIIWLMPIHPIGEKNRKGSLGSQYAVKDYYGVNPEFGNSEDLKEFIHVAHELGLYVILDWVANHTSWDNSLVTDHPEWYKRDYKGDFHPTPWWDWSDIIELDYDQFELRKYMSEAMKYWVQEFDVDGFRCDVAGFVPIDFWNTVRKELDAVKPVFMLAEWESRDLHAEAFDMTYAWTWNKAVEKICKGEAEINELYIYYSWNESAFPKNALRMTFVSNHDMNAWEGTMYEKFGEGLEAAIALSVVGEGMPLIYNGEEAGNTKRLEFFEKDPIEWKEHPIGDLYKNLLALLKENTALWHLHPGAKMIHVPNNHEKEVFSFVRMNEKDKVFAVFNFSDSAKEVHFGESLFIDLYIDFADKTEIEFTQKTKLKIDPWGYKIYVKMN